MSHPNDEPDLEAVCEFLGLADDPESHATYATEAHRCYRLPNPTRIAGTHQESYCLVENHTNCPVYLGEGVAQTTRTASAPPTAPRGRGDAETVRTAGAAPRERSPRPPRQRPGREGVAGTLGPRPRPGGISMPAATIGLLVLAVAIVGLAFLVQNLLGGDDDGTPAGPLGQQTQTAQAGGGETPDTTVGETPTAETPAAGDDETPGAGDGDATPDETPDDGDGETPGGGGGDGGTYVVEPGDFCSTIASNLGVSIEELQAANPEINADCTNLFAGQELVIP